MYLLLWDKLYRQNKPHYTVIPAQLAQVSPSPLGLSVALPPPRAALAHPDSNSSFRLLHRKSASDSILISLSTTQTPSQSLVGTFVLSFSSSPSLPLSPSLSSSTLPPLPHSVSFISARFFLSSRPLRASTGVRNLCALVFPFVSLFLFSFFLFCSFLPFSPLALLKPSGFLCTSSRGLSGNPLESYPS